MPVDVLQRDDRVIDNARERQSQAAQDHGVHGAAEQVERDESRQRGEGNGKEYRHRGPEAAQKSQDHQAGQEEPDQPFVKQRFNGLLDEGRLIEDH